MEQLSLFFAKLCQDGSVEEHRAEAEAILAGAPPSTLPLVVFMADGDAGLIGFVEVGLRSHADGYDPVRPVGFVEGWYVEPEHRRRGMFCQTRSAVFRPDLAVTPAKPRFQELG